MTDKITLAECPVGLFLANGALCLKTEYGNNEGRIDAYIVSSGEFFWGDAPQTIASQRVQLVTPVDEPTILTALRNADHAEVEKAAYKRGWDDREDDLILGVSRTGAPPSDRFDAGRAAGIEAAARWAQGMADNAMSSLNSGSNNAEFRSAHKLCDWFKQVATDIRSLSPTDLRVISAAQAKEIAEAWAAVQAPTKSKLLKAEQLKALGAALMPVIGGSHD